MRRCSRCISGTLVTFWIGTKAMSSFGTVRISMKVRRQLLLQKLQRVLSLRVVRYSILRTAHQLFVSQVATHAVFFTLAEFNRAHGGKILSVLHP